MGCSPTWASRGSTKPGSSPILITRLFTYLGFKGEYKAWELANPDYQLEAVSRTFHGRDIFAPAAAHAANGIGGPAFGQELPAMDLLPTPLLDISNSTIQGEILSQDHFGNLITSLGCFQRNAEGILLTSWIHEQTLTIPAGARINVQAGNQTFKLARTFHDLPAGKGGALIGSTGLLEIDFNRSSAAEQTGLDRGERIILTWS